MKPLARQELQEAVGKGQIILLSMDQAVGACASDATMHCCGHIALEKTRVQTFKQRLYRYQIGDKKCGGPGSDNLIADAIIGCRKALRGQ